MVCLPQTGHADLHRQGLNKATYEEAVKSDMPGFAYSASNKLAEQAAHDVVKESGELIKMTTLARPSVSIRTIRFRQA
ncbi:unnamed protein product [Tilletia controversa]|uniref:Uncharacterized protein n=2 Tax=Tilletia TaxID=13289 RepID=A0A9N8M2N5_9BASI|nr:hypothetical protein CF336_g8560 [Tilletia laevis]KAE8240973.1 hypothetical protein A4X03_0g8249 [Tilletia caries]CAD6908935.1 unnamed protein product [Tilletia controversa]CAD6927375.1 unnamed protein product [Tilletia controversa]CAD6949162.1 unnamed protein product [Tilletia laevis]